MRELLPMGVGVSCGRGAAAVGIGVGSEGAVELGAPMPPHAKSIATVVMLAHVTSRLVDMIISFPKYPVSLAPSMPISGVAHT